MFVDDNPAERALVADQLPEVAVPDVGSDVTRFAEILEAEHYFEVHKLVQDDLNRSAYYSLNAQRSALSGRIQGLRGVSRASLEMTAEIAPFSSMYLERITQLINKTNQFNLTTRRYTSAEVETIAQDPMFVTLYGRLADKFGDNGLVSVLIGRTVDDALEIDIWLMSCRVLNREMELAMFDALVEQCQARGIRKIVGIYIPSNKNSMVADHYLKLGFTAVEGSPESLQSWHYDLPQSSRAKARHIERTPNSACAIVESGLTPDPKSVSVQSREVPSGSQCLASH